MMLKQTGKEVALEFNLPDFKKDDIKVDLSKDFVIIKAERKIEKRVQKKNFFHAEKSSNVFDYKTSVPAIDYKKAKIEFKEGVLKIKVPKL